MEIFSTKISQFFKINSIIFSMERGRDAVLAIVVADLNCSLLGRTKLLQICLAFPMSAISKAFTNLYSLNQILAPLETQITC